MQGDWDLNAHIPAVMIDIASIGSGIYFGVFGLQNSLITEASANLKQLLLDLNRMIEGLMNSLMIGHVVRI